MVVIVVVGRWFGVLVGFVVVVCCGCFFVGSGRFGWLLLLLFELMV